MMHCVYSLTTLFVLALFHVPLIVHASGDDGDHHDHESCACAAKEHGVTIDCNNTQAMLDALPILLNNNCSTNCASELCKKNYLIVQAHHDYCPEADLPEPVEDGIHLYEDACEDCEIVRLPDPSLPDCPVANCEDGSGNAAYTALLTEGCNTTDACASETCRDNFRILRAVHDTCPEDALAIEAELGIHNFEETCALQSCNVGTDIAGDQTVCVEEPHHHESCACAAEEHDFTINCDDTGAMRDAVALLSSNKCGTDCSSEVCMKNFLIVQAHHDYCPEDGVPPSVEDALHIYESNCEECKIVPLPDPSLPDCPTISCTDGSGNGAYGTLISEGCDTADSCQNSDVCRDSFRILRAVHDSCPEDALERVAEQLLHSLEEPCKPHNCNIGADITANQLVCNPEDPSPADTSDSMTSKTPATMVVVVAFLVAPFL